MVAVFLLPDPVLQVRLLPIALCPARREHADHGQQRPQLCVCVLDAPQVLICLALAIGLAMLDIRTSAMINEEAHTLQTAADAALAMLLILGLVFFNNVVLQRTWDLSYVRDSAACSLPSPPRSSGLAGVHGR